MTHEKRESQWSSPERQEDLKYQEKMKEFFSPSSTGGNDVNGGRMRHPLKEDTAVIDHVEPGRDQDTPPRGYAPQSCYPRAAERGVQGKTVREPARDPKGLDLRRILLFALAALGVVVFLVLVWWLLFGRGGGDAGRSQEPQKTPAAVSENAPEPSETNLTFEAQDGKGDAYSVRMGEYEWEGTEGMNGDVEEVIMEGRTAAHFTTAVRLADGEITTGVFGRAEPDRPLWHATFQRTTTDGQQSTTGTYQVIDKKRVILEGAYTDRIVEDNPGKEPDVVVREYVEGDPRKGDEDVERSRAKFRASEGVEIPWLPGNPIAEGGEEGDANGGEQE